MDSSADKTTEPYQGVAAIPTSARRVPGSPPMLPSSRNHCDQSMPGLKTSLELCIRATVVKHVGNCCH